MARVLGIGIEAIAEGKTPLTNPSNVPAYDPSELSWFDKASIALRAGVSDWWEQSVPSVASVGKTLSTLQTTVKIGAVVLGLVALAVILHEARSFASK